MGKKKIILEMESGQMVSSPSFATNERLSIEPPRQGFHEKAFV